MDIAASRAYITNRTEWVIDDRSFRVLDEEQCIWIAKVTTTHQKRSGEEEITFAVIVNGYNYFTISEDLLPALKVWCEEHPS